MSKYISIEELYGFYLNAKQQICTDTRKLEAGSVFFALKGGNFNANEFAQKAINAGCSIAVVDEEKYVSTIKTLNIIAFEKNVNLVKEKGNNSDCNINNEDNFSRYENSISFFGR